MSKKDPMEAYLVGRLGEERGEQVFSETEELLGWLVTDAVTEGKNQDKVLKEALLPRIALYRTLLNDGMPKDEAIRFMEDAILEVTGKSMRKTYDRLDMLPFFYTVFKKGMVHVVTSKPDLWTADIDTSEKDSFSVTMRKCFWKDTFDKYGCPEIAYIACKCDDVTYDGLKHAKFERTQTLGCGGECCDFRFTKRK